MEIREMKTTKQTKMEKLKKMKLLQYLGKWKNELKIKDLIKKKVVKIEEERRKEEKWTS